jgi:intraflagellar transport protein 140
VYVLAGNFLQNQNWHNDPEVMKTIISFYQKAKSFESLANFYDACAQVEIDEYRDYEKALGAMKEAQRQLEKSTA